MSLRGLVLVGFIEHFGVVFKVVHHTSIKIVGRRTLWFRAFFVVDFFPIQRTLCFLSELVFWIFVP